MSRRSGTKGFILCSLVILLTFFSGAAFGASAVVENNSTNTTKYNNNPPIETTNTDRYGMWSRNGASVENAKKTGSYYDPNPTTISTEGNNSHGMVAQGYGKPFLITYYSKAFNYGSIITTGDEAYGMWATGGAEIHNEKEDLSTGFWKTELFTGSITTTGPGSHGMMAEGTGSKAWNSGTINTEGPNSYGMLATGGAEVHNFDWHGISASPGTITTEGEGSHGMAAEGTGSKAWNSGTIFTKGNGSYGMLATGGAEVHNFDWYLLPSPGTITTEGEGSHGMAAEGTGSKAWNSGTINTEGPNSYGMLATGGAEVHNFDWYLLPSPGTITTEGEGSHGMVAEGSGSQAWNGGNIATEKDHSYGMWATNGARVNSFYGILLGDIETKGFGSHGMVAEGSGSQAWNGGHIDTIGESAYGMWATGGAQAFNVGIHFDAWGLFTLDLGGNIETGGADSHGMVAEGSGSIVGNIGSSITTKGDGAFGMVASGDSIAANLGKVETQGSSSHGMAAHNFALALNAGFGEGSIIPGTIETTSGDAYGMWGHDLGLVVNAGEIDTEGDRSHGMVAQNTSVAVNFGLSNLGSDLLGGLLKTIGLGDLSSIVEGLGGGLPGEITTTGDSAHGMVARNWSAAINLSKIATHGENSFGMQAEDFGLALNMGDIATEKDGSHGMVAEDRSIAVNAGSPLSAVGNLLSGLIPDNLIEGIDLKTIVSSLFGGGSSKIETWGDDAHGMVARNWSAAINLDEIVTHGGNSYGMHAEDFGLALNMGQITTGDPDDSSIGTGSHGMVAEDRSIAVNAGSPLSAVGNLLSGLIPDNLIEGIDLKTIVSSLFGSGSSKIETWGDDAHGMVARNWSVAINLDEITTHGSGAHGMEAFDHSMITNVDTDSIETFGDEAFGMYAFHHSLGLNTGAITTHGLKSHGMVAKDDSLIINTGPIVTLNHGAVGMKAQMDSTALNLEGSIVTSGHGAHGMFAEDDSTAVSIGSIVTSGHGAVGMKAKNDSTAVSVGNIETSGNRAHGMYTEDDSTAVSIGSIITSGHGAVGMKAKNDSTAVSVGSIVTSGHGAHGMVADDPSTVINIGTIITSGNGAIGMFANHDSLALSIGSIKTSGHGAHGMYAEDDSEAINIGSIITSGHGAVGVKAADDSFGLSVGSIITSGHGAHGMYAEDDSTAVSIGSIVTSGHGAMGMKAKDDSTAVSVGSIVTSGHGAHGMFANDNSQAFNIGSIITSGHGAVGMKAKDDSTAVSVGNIETSGNRAHGMFAEDDSTAVSIGSIVTSGHGAVGMKAKNDSTAVSVGSIVTSGHGAHGMYAEDDSEAINIGSIVTSGHGAVGMKAKNDSFGLSVGSIITSGHGAHGMYAEDESVVVNTGLGLVTTTGNHSAGMRAQSDSEALNEGLIITFGRASHGMLLGDGSFGKNSGAILTFGPDSDAVRLYDSKFVNRGILGSFGDGGYALSAFDDSFAILLDGTVLAGSHTLWGDDTSRLLVRMDDPTQTDPFSAQVQGFDLFTKRGTGWMTLEEGSFVDGHTAHKGGTLEIESQTQFTTNTYSQSLGSTLYVYMNPGSYTDNDEIPLWVEGDADIRGMLTIDASTGSMPGFYTYIRANDYGTSNFETEFVNKDPLFTYYMPQWIEVSSWHYTSMVGYSFSHAALGMVAAIDDWSLLRYAMANHLNDVADCMKQLEVGEKKIHAQVLAGQTKRDPSSATSAGFDSTQKGISLGFDKKQDDSTLWGLYVGYTEKDIDFTGLPMVYADWESQDTWHFGAYISKRWDKWILSDTLTYRRASHDTFRKQVGGDARASFDSWAVTNDLRLGYVAKEIGEGSHWQVIPEVGLNVGYINRGGYTEDNGFTYGDFSHTVVESVVGIRFKGEYLRADGSTFIPQLRLGWAHILSGEDITIEQSWGGTTYSFTESLDRDYLVADLGLSLCKYGNMDLSLNYGGRFGSNSTTHGGWLRLEWKF